MKNYKSFNFPQAITRLKTSPDGALIASLSGTHSLTVWNGFTFEPIASFEVGTVIRDFAISPDLAKIALVTAKDEHNKPAAASKVQLFNIVSRSLEAEYLLGDFRSVTFIS